MKRIIMMVLRNLFFVPYGWFMLNWYAGHVDDYPEEKRYALLKKIDRNRRKHYDQVLRSREYSVGEWFYVLSESSGTV